jgi:hypothetical protein
MTGIWQTVYAMAAFRHETNVGEGHLSKNALTVLEHFAQTEAQEAVAAAWGNTTYFVIPAGNA